jgi:NADH dehydrogenase/NADH:ubiquinone oxidoreductase subunit G
VEEAVELSIDGKSVRVAPGTTVLEAASSVGVEIPVICYFAHTTANGLCRLCVVETSGAPGLQAACVSEVQQGAEIQTRTEAIDRSRRTILEMLASTVDLSESPEILEFMEEYDAHPQRFSGAETLSPPIIDDNSLFIRDYAKCVMCWRCVQVCAEDAQYAYAINFGGRGFHTSIATFFDKPIPSTTCVFCGQCVGVCPSGALKAKREHLFEQGMTPNDIFSETRIGGKRKRRKGGAGAGQ